jgi:hypothetical protein
VEDEDEVDAEDAPMPAPSAAAADAAAERRAILERLSRGEIDPAAAATELRDLAEG